MDIKRALDYIFETKREDEDIQNNNDNLHELIAPHSYPPVLQPKHIYVIGAFEIADENFKKCKDVLFLMYEDNYSEDEIKDMVIEKYNELNK